VGHNNLIEKIVAVNTLSVKKGVSPYEFIVVSEDVVG